MSLSKSAGCTVHLFDRVFDKCKAKGRKMDQLCTARSIRHLKKGEFVAGRGKRGKPTPGQIWGQGGPRWLVHAPWPPSKIIGKSGRQFSHVQNRKQLSKVVVLSWFIDHPRRVSMRKSSSWLISGNKCDRNPRINYSGQTKVCKTEKSRTNRHIVIKNKGGSERESGEGPFAHGSHRTGLPCGHDWRAS